METYNKVVKLCEQGMKAETEGWSANALKLYIQAWEESKGNDLPQDQYGDNLCREIAEAEKRFRQI